MLEKLEEAFIFNTLMLTDTTNVSHDRSQADKPSILMLFVTIVIFVTNLLITIGFFIHVH